MKIIVFIITIILGFIVYCTTLKMINKEYRIFTPHPVMPLYFYLSYNREFTEIQTIAATIAYAVFYLPLTPFWFIAWCLWEGINYIVSQFINDSLPDSKWESND